MINLRKNDFIIVIIMETNIIKVGKVVSNYEVRYFSNNFITVSVFIIAISFIIILVNYNLDLVLFKLVMA